MTNYIFDKDDETSLINWLDRSYLFNSQLESKLRFLVKSSLKAFKFPCGYAEKGLTGLSVEEKGR